ncbi:hypothetical protein [Pseudoroseomonas cervicalis]|uniref:hypothetical protein n=1 Tax=Teichococcus cervicalis TaxID=204525 RepID=UPI002786E177|nr:hypothetical protein [Pseudoroseomonas cervicalis]MDQ1081451.1 hypothetical protein [Pseudoroseomonas cervicalis]
MAILQFPTGIARPAGLSWLPRANTQSHTSPLDGTTQTLQMPGMRWVVTLTWEDLKPEHWRILGAFIAQLGGQAGRFTYGPWHAPRTAPGVGAPVVDGAGQAGDLLVTRGWPNFTRVFNTGDWLSYPDAQGRPMLHQVVANSSSNGTGQAATRLAPPLRRPGADGAAVEVVNPVGVFMLASDDDGEIRFRKPVRASTSLQLVEALV